jgi:hypothetical protein
VRITLFLLLVMTHISRTGNEQIGGKLIVRKWLTVEIIL